MNTHKTCSVCKESKPLDHFPRDRHRTYNGGIFPRCNACRKSKYWANRERELAHMRDYRARNREKLSVKAKVYASRRFFYIRSRNLSTRHIDGPVATPQELAGLWRKQRGVCPFTGIRLNKHNAQLDHIVPLVNGGQGAIGNLRWVHRDVNYAKRDLSDTQFIALCHMVAARKSNEMSDLRLINS